MNDIYSTCRHKYKTVGPILPVQREFGAGGNVLQCCVTFLKFLIDLLNSIIGHGSQWCETKPKNATPTTYMVQLLAVNQSELDNYLDIF